jgi:C4-dicarboxylate-specific signal transduction histidine kinase/CheY-like chemotaxis protein
MSGTKRLHGPRPAPPIALDALRAKVRELAVRCEAALERRAAAAADRRSAIALASSVLQATRSGMALVRRGRLVARNRSWVALDRDERSGDWRSEGRSYGTLHALLLGEVARILDAGEVVRELRFERGRPEQVLSLRLERLHRSGEPLVLAIARDLTERVRAEREVERARQLLVEQEQARAVGELASGVAHDLNNVLHAIALRVEGLRRDGASTERREAGLDALSRLVTDAASRVARLQDLARRRRDAPQSSLELAPVLRAAAAVVAPPVDARREGGLEVALDVPWDLPPVRGEPMELRHVFVSLLLNARDAMPSGGTVHVAAERRERAVVVRLRDEGGGIAPEALPRLFDPFFTTKGQKGTGLGLPIARSVMLRLGGAIRAANAAEGGAVFELEFPIAGEEAAAGPSSPAPAAPRPAARVLVVDDDPDVLEAARLVLEDLGQQVDTAPCGRAALARIAAGERYDVVLCDVGMPDLNGWRVAEELRALTPATPVYLVTGWAHEIAVDDPRRRLVAGILPKPLPMDALVAALPAANGGSDGRARARS